MKKLTLVFTFATIFLQFDGSVLVYEGKETAYPVFINESAYREKGIAMALTKVLHLPIGSW